MENYIKIFKYDDDISVCFFIDHKDIMAIGEKMEAINENAYMNGYNWEAFFRCYLEKKAPELLKNYDTDSEACTFVAIYPATSFGQKQAKILKELIESLVKNEEILYQFVCDYGNEIEWD